MISRQLGAVFALIILSSKDPRCYPSLVAVYSLLCNSEVFIMTSCEQMDWREERNLTQEDVT